MNNPVNLTTLLLIGMLGAACWGGGYQMRAHEAVHAQDLSTTWTDALKHEAASPHFTLAVTVSAPGVGIDRSTGTLVVDQTTIDYLMHECKTDLDGHSVPCDTSPAHFVLQEVLRRIPGAGMWWPITFSGAN